MTTVINVHQREFRAGATTVSYTKLYTIQGARGILSSTAIVWLVDRCKICNMVSSPRKCCRVDNHCWWTRVGGQTSSRGKSEQVSRSLRRLRRVMCSKCGPCKNSNRFRVFVHGGGNISNPSLVNSSGFFPASQCTTRNTGVCCYEARAKGSKRVLRLLRA